MSRQTNSEEQPSTDLRVSDCDAKCSLCGAARLIPFWADKRRSYLRCQVCALISVPTSDRVSSDEERAEYDLHQNSPNDLGYRRFLSRLVTPLLERLEAGGIGLDFGCGPGPTLSRMLEEAGHQVDLYDIFYAPDRGVFERHYDFITATEVVEHLGEPGRELTRLWQMLRSGGILALMTKLAKDADAFASWHYKNDKTHIAFFSEASFRWLASEWQCNVEFVAPDVVFLHKPVI